MISDLEYLGETTNPEFLTDNRDESSAAAGTQATHTREFGIRSANRSVCVYFTSCSQRATTTALIDQPETTERPQLRITHEIESEALSKAGAQLEQNSMVSTLNAQQKLKW